MKMGDGDGRADTRAPVVGRGDAREDPLVLEIAVESAKGKTGRLGERGGGEEKGRKKRREGEERVNEPNSTIKASWTETKTLSNILQE